jgi:hypothetical protein
MPRRGEELLRDIPEKVEALIKECVKGLLTRRCLSMICQVSSQTILHLRRGRPMHLIEVNLAVVVRIEPEVMLIVALQRNISVRLELTYGSMPSTQKAKLRSLS